MWSWHKGAMWLCSPDLLCYFPELFHHRVSDSKTTVPSGTPEITTVFKPLKLTAHTALSPS